MVISHHFKAVERSSLASRQVTAVIALWEESRFLVGERLRIYC